MIYYDPFRRMERLMDVMDRLLDRSVVPTQAVEDIRRGKTSIPVDVRAEDEAFVITAWVPGVSAEDLHIEVVDDTVTLEGDFKAGDENGYLLREIPRGAFRRAITLPTALEPGEAEAELRDGVLTLRVPKAKALRPREIKIKVKHVVLVTLHN